MRKSPGRTSACKPQAPIVLGDAAGVWIRASLSYSRLLRGAVALSSEAAFSLSRKARQQGPWSSRGPRAPHGSMPAGIRPRSVRPKCTPSAPRRSGPKQLQPAHPIASAVYLFFWLCVACRYSPKPCAPLLQMDVLLAAESIYPCAAVLHSDVSLGNKTSRLGNREEVSKGERRLQTEGDLLWFTRFTVLSSYLTLHDGLLVRSIS